MEKLKVTSCSNCEHLVSAYCDLLNEEIPDRCFYGNWKYIPSNCPLKDKVGSNGSEN